jgi:hypothetical protein
VALYRLRAAGSVHYREDVRQAEQGFSQEPASSLVFTPSTLHHPRAMGDKADKLVGCYPIYVIPHGIDWFGPPPVDIEKDPELKERFELLREAPTLTPLKGLVLGKYQQLNEDQYCSASPLITWTLASPAQMAAIRAEIVADSKVDKGARDLGSFEKCIVETITTFEGSTIFTSFSCLGPR